MKDTQHTEPVKKKRGRPPAPFDLELTIRAYNELAAKLDKAVDKIDQYQRTMGQHIAAIKEARDDWEVIVKERLKVARSRAYELLSIYAGTKTSEQLRLEKAKSVKRSRAKKKSPLRSGRQPHISKEQQRFNEYKEREQSAGNDVGPEASAAARKAAYTKQEGEEAGIAPADTSLVGDRHFLLNLNAAWSAADEDARRDFVRERQDEIVPLLPVRAAESV